MARYKCPCCGEPYNGKRCKNCFYENFTEEIAHGNHSHAGEPLVIRQPTPMKKPRATITRESDCKPYVGKKKEKKITLKWLVVVVVVLLSLVSKIGEAVGTVNVSDWLPEYGVTMPLEAAVPEVLESGFRLYDDGQVLLVADWGQGQEFKNPISLWMRNDTGLELSAMPESIYVNGYRMEYASFYCETEPGETARGELWLDEEELANCGITDVQQILLDISLVDQENYDLYDRSGLVALEFAVPIGFEQPIDDSGVVLYDRDGVRLIFRRVVGTACEDAWLEMYIENNSDRVMDINFGSVAVDDIQAEVYLFCHLEPGTRAITSASLWNLPDVGIDAVSMITEMKVSLELIPEGDWDGLVLTEPLTIMLK